MKELKANPLVTISYNINTKLYEIYDHEMNHTSRCSTLEMACEITEAILTDEKDEREGNIVKELGFK